MRNLCAPLLDVAVERPFSLVFRVAKPRFHKVTRWIARLHGWPAGCRINRHANVELRPIIFGVMTLWFVFALMTAAAIFAVIWPLAGYRKLRSGSDIEVYRDQLKELERDREIGLIPESEAETAQAEISRRLLAAADMETAAAGRPPTGSAVWRRRAVALAAVVLLPFGAAALYLTLGSPLLSDQPLASRVAKAREDQTLENLIAQVEAFLERNPQDGRGWEVIAPVYLRLGRVDDAVKARRNALRINGETAERQTHLGEALVAAANGVVTTDAKAAFDRAVELDPRNVKARYFQGLAAEQDGEREDAAKIWRAMLAEAPADASWTEFVRQALARVEGDTPPRGPSEDAVTAASDLSPEQRSAMVRGMVERLAERLRKDGSDVEGWLRLVRSYVVLGDRDNARSAANEARRALAGQPDKVRRLDELAKGLGLEG
jgi:cytochrome c-type biogenesis protein CcmH